MAWRSPCDPCQSLQRHGPCRLQLLRPSNGWVVVQIWAACFHRISKSLHTSLFSASRNTATDPPTEQTFFQVNTLTFVLKYILQSMGLKLVSENQIRTSNLQSPKKVVTLSLQRSTLRLKSRSWKDGISPGMRVCIFFLSQELNNMLNPPLDRSIRPGRKPAIACKCYCQGL